MAQKMSSSSAQCSITYALSNLTKDNDTLELTDSEGIKIVSKEIPLGFEFAVISSPKLKVNETYTLSVSDVSKTITTDSVSTYVGDASSENPRQMGVREEGMTPPDMDEGEMTPLDMGDTDDGQDRLGPPDVEEGQDLQEENEECDTPKEVTDKEWLWLGVSFGVLIAGVGFARFYRRCC